MIEISEHRCLQHARGESCGARWFQATVDGHTVGACGHTVVEDDVATVVPFAKGDLPLTVVAATDNGQQTIVLSTAKGEAVAAIVFTVGAS